MKSKNLFVAYKLPLWFFSVVMIFLYLTGFLYPSENDFWLVKNGYTIIYLEFFSILATFCIFFWYDKEIQDKNTYLACLIFISFVVFGLTFIYNIALFFYYLVSLVIKYFAFKKSEKISWDGFKNSGISMIIFFISLFSAYLLARGYLSFFNDVFSQQIRLIYMFEEELIKTSTESIPFFTSTAHENIVQMFLWGLIYFILLLITELIWIFYKLKKRKNAEEEI